MSTALFPLLGIIFAFVVAVNFAMSHFVVFRRRVETAEGS